MQQRTQLDFSKLYCHLHPMQLITNYCNDEKCLIGLCATCVCSHTEIHAQLGTVAQYQNIRDTFSSLHDEVRNQISYIEEDKNRLGRLREEIEIKKINIRKTIKQLKEETLNKVKDDFDQLEKKIINDIISQQKKQGYHSNLRFETLRKNLNRQTETLITYIEGLNSTLFVEWSKKLKRDLLTESQVIRNNLEKQLEDNQTYTANLKWNQNYLSQISSIIKKMFSLEFVIPKSNQTNCVKAVNGNLTLSRASSLPRFSSNFQSGSNFYPKHQSRNSFYQNQSNLLKQSSKPKNEEYLTCELSESKVYGKQNSMYRSVLKSPSNNDDLITRSNLMSSINYFPKSTIDTFKQSDSRMRLL